MACYVYILYSETLKQYYKGSCNDIEKRLHEHNSEKQHATKAGAPWSLILVMEKRTISEARILERKIKNITSRARLEAFIVKYGGKIPY